MGDRSHLVPTTVTDKHGNAVIRHVRPSDHASATGTSIPAPRASAAQATLANKYRDLIPSTDNDEEVNEKFELIDPQVLDDAKALIRRNGKWHFATRRLMSKMLGKGMDASHFEMRLKQLLAVASIAERIQERDFILGGTTVERSLTESYNLLYRWGIKEWDEASRQRLDGIMILYAISGDLKTNTQALLKSDADWVGARAEAIIPLVPQLTERRAMTPSAIQTLLDVDHSALAEGAL